MKIRQFAAILLTLFLGLTFKAYSQSEDAVVGHWLTADKTAQIAIQKSGGSFTGEVIWLRDPTVDGKPLTDKNNENPELRDRQLIGLTMISGLKYEKGMWKGGEIYDPKSGKTYSCELKLLPDNVLEVRGYVGFSFAGKSVKWTRVK